MTATLLGKVDPQDLAVWRDICANEYVVGQRAALFSRDELLALARRKYQFMAGCVERYGLDDSYLWSISAATGLIVQGEAWVPRG